MNKDLYVAVICIRDILREDYGLTIEEAVDCILKYANIAYINDNEKALELFLHTDYRTWAKKMYEKNNKRILKRIAPKRNA